MQSKMVKMLALALVLAGVDMALAQTPPSSAQSPRSVQPGTSLPQTQKAPAKKSKLEEMLAEALKNSPDIRVAVAKLAMAEAELNQARLQVMQKVFTLHAALESQKAEVELRQKQYERFRELSAQGSIDSKLLDEALAKLTAAKGKLAELEAQMSGLLGKSPQGEYSLTLQEAKLVRQEAIRSTIQTRRARLIEDVEVKIAHKVAGPMAEKIRKALSRPISVSFENRPVSEIVDALSRDSGLVIKLAEHPAVRFPEKLTVRCENLPFGAVLQLLEDSLPYYTIVVRDYGLLITHCQSVPPGAISLQEFLRQKPTEK